MLIYKNWTKIVVDLSIETGDSCPVLEIVKRSCKNGIKAKTLANKCHNTFRNRLSVHYHYAVIKTEIAKLGKLTALSEEAVSLISSNYSPYSKV